MDKDFDRWNKEKKRIHGQAQFLPLYHEREIRWCRLGVNIGFEQDGTGAEHSRPVLIMKGFSRQVCFVIPLTTSVKKNRYYVPIGDVEGRKASAIISQLRLIDTKRLDQHIAILNQERFKIIRKAVKDLL